MESYEKQGPLHEMFIRQAKATPDNLAVVDSTDRPLTFAQLDHLSETMATNLHHKGVKPNSCVAIYMDKSIEYVVSYIAILRAGGSYLPLDISYPDLLLQDILKDSEPVAILTEESLAERVKGKCGIL